MASLNISLIKTSKKVKNIKTILSFIILSTFLKVDNIFAAFWEENIIPDLKSSDKTLDVVVQNWIIYALSFLSIVAVLYWLYWWFLIFTAWGEEEKSKKWRTVIFQALLGIVVIFLAWSIVTFFLWWSWNTWIFN
jgi:hypothetical protein